LSCGGGIMVAPAKGNECAFTGILADTGSSAAVPPHSTTGCWPVGCIAASTGPSPLSSGLRFPGVLQFSMWVPAPGGCYWNSRRARSDLRLVGVDPSDDMIRRAREHARTAGLEDRIEFETVPAESLPFPAGTFDLVLSTLSAHHWADPAAAINEQARVLRPGGQLRIYDLRREGLEGLTPVVASAMGGTVQHRERLAGIMGSRIGCLTSMKRAGANS
jgi:SAM-dependent methyltransferase